MDEPNDIKPGETAPGNEKVAKIKPIADAPFVPNPADEVIVPAGAHVEPAPRIPGIGDANVARVPKRVEGVAKPGLKTAHQIAAEAAREEQDRLEADAHAAASQKAVEEGAQHLVKMENGREEIEVHPSTIDAHKARGWRVVRA